MLNYACADALILFPILQKMVLIDSSLDFFETAMRKSESCYEKLKVEVLVVEMELIN